MKTSITFHSDRIALTLPTLKAFDAEYPRVEAEAIARSINLVDVFLGDEFLTQINVERYRRAADAYAYRRLSVELTNSQN